MNCPACKTDMLEQDFGGIKVDVCKNGCKGIWFDWFELEKLDEKHEGCGNALKEALESSRAKDENRDQIACPKCQKPMRPHLYKSAKEVTVDECYLCGGFFLDSGELKIIRENFMTEEQRDAFVNELIGGIEEEFNTSDNQEKNDRRKASANKLFDFLKK